MILSLLSLTLYSQEDYLNYKGNTIKTRYQLETGYSRIKVDSGSYSWYCRNLPLKPIHSLVKYYNGVEKPKNNIYTSVIDQDISNRDLQQCADATMRIRGEYLFSAKKFNSIHFNFLSDGKPRYFTKYAGNKRDYKTFRKYMDYVFAFANTASLYEELKSIEKEKIKPGDVIIVKGNPYGHAVIVLDVIENNKGDKKVLLGQSYMPAQETQILINPVDETPWFSITNNLIKTPEWDFINPKIGRFR